MILDSSAIVAVIRREPGHGAIHQKLHDAESLKVSAATLVEVGIVVDGARLPEQSRLLDRLLAALGVQVVDLTAEHAVIARLAYRDYGKGSGHPAGLDFGDCFSYALASATGEPLLFVGDDFTHTDLVAA